MDKVNYLSRVRAHSKFLNQALGVLGNGNIAKLIKATGLTFGVVTEKLPSGVLDIDMKVEQSSDTSVFINPGYFISYDGTEIRIVEVPNTPIDLTSQPDDTDLRIYAIPNSNSYEAGTLTFTNGSKTVVITDGSFAKLDPYESLVITDSISGNDGVYEIYEIPSAGSLELVNIFTGTTESGLTWKIAGNFKGYKTATATDLIYTYDDYEIAVSTQDSAEGLLLAIVRKTAGVISSITDSRSDNLFSMKTLSKTVADDIIKGVTKDITTIEEKASAATIDLALGDLIKEGYVTGLGLTIEGDNLLIGSGAVYNSQGKRIAIPSTLTVGLNQYVTSGDIILGDTNYLYISYVSPNSYSLSWSQSSTTAIKNKILIGRLEYTDAGTVPYILMEDVKNPIKHKMNCITFQNKPILSPEENDMYIKNGRVYYQWLDKSLRDPVLQEIELIGFKRLNTILNNALKSIAKSEKIRFSLFPNAEKDAWFMFNGIQSPALIGYRHKIVGWKVGVMDMGTAAGTYSVFDYTTKETAKGARFTSVVSKTLALPVEADSSLGIYFDGNSTLNTIQLISNGVVIDYTNMHPVDTDDLGQAVINKLYVVEVAVETTEDIITIDPATES